MKFMFIYRCDNSCIDSEEVVIWLFYGSLEWSIDTIASCSLAYTLMNESL